MPSSPELHLGFACRNKLIAEALFALGLIPVLQLVESQPVEFLWVSVNGWIVGDGVRWYQSQRSTWYHSSI